MRLGPLGWLRFFWRRLTEMRTALVLLLMLALAAVPGSLVPQNSADPNGVIEYQAEHPGLYRVLDFLQAFDTYTSVWFSAIYLLLFVSLIGCVLPRAKHHVEQLRARPPRTPARLERMAGHRSVTSPEDAETELATAAAVLRRAGYRVQRYGEASGESLSAERGYLRETGNLVFHLALVGILVAVAVGGAYGFTGQRLVVEGSKFVNTRGDYDSISAGRLVDTDELTPYRIALDGLDVSYSDDEDSYGEATDYTAHITTTIDGETTKRQLKVNSPLDIGGTRVYLLGTGYAPVVTVRDPDGDVVFSQAVPFLAQDSMMTSTGVVKVPDGLPVQLGLVGFFYPTVAQSTSADGALASSYPALDDPLLSLNVYTGDLGLDDDLPRNVYELDVSQMTEIAGAGTGTDALQLGIGDTVELPGGLGSVELSAVRQYVSLDIHHDPAQAWVGGFAVLVVLGLLTGLFVPRRRLWVRVLRTDAGSRVEYAGLARGEDPRLEAAVAEIAARHAARRAGPPPR
ncbi:MAG: cytochrome c biogenesis protein ResB [Microbacteriaceae bacterium]